MRSVNKPTNQSSLVFHFGGRYVLLMSTLGEEAIKRDVRK